MAQPRVLEDPEPTEPDAELQPEPSDSADMKIEVDPMSGRLAVQAKLTSKRTAEIIGIIAFVAAPVLTVVLGTSSGAPTWAPYVLALTELLVGLAIVWMLLRSRAR